MKWPFFYLMWKVSRDHDVIKSHTPHLHLEEDLGQDQNLSSIWHIPPEREVLSASICPIGYSQLHLKWPIHMKTNGRPPSAKAYDIWNDRFIWKQTGGLLQLKLMTFEMTDWLFLTSFHMNSDLQFYIRHPIGVKWTSLYLNTNDFHSCVSM
jgi:hypothetical protein